MVKAVFRLNCATGSRFAVAVWTKQITSYDERDPVFGGDFGGIRPIR